MIESEKKLEKYLADQTKQSGGWSFKLLSTHVTGLPDRICLFPGGKVFFAEMKTTGKKPTKMQELIGNKIRRLGFEVLVLDNTNSINEIIRSYEKDSTNKSK